MKLRRNQIPEGHKEGRASFPIQSQYKVSKIHTSNSTPREGRRRTETERRQEKGGAHVWLLGQGHPFSVGLPFSLILLTSL